MTARRLKPGPKPRAGKTATGRIEVRVTVAEQHAWERAADKEHLSLSEWLRAAAELAIARGSTR